MPTTAPNPPPDAPEDGAVAGAGDDDGPALRAARYPRPPVSRAEAEWVWRLLSSEALAADAAPESVRLAAIVGLVRATGARYSDLLRCTVDMLDLGPAAARQGTGRVLVLHGTRQVAREHTVPSGTALVLRRWLEVRAELAAELEGSVPRALLLTVHHTHDHGVTVARGLPITRQGLVLSWRRFVHRTNARHGATRPPLPTRFEQVRRAWAPAAGE